MDFIGDRNFSRDWHCNRFILKLRCCHCPRNQCHFNLLLYSILLQFFMSFYLLEIEG